MLARPLRIDLCGTGSATSPKGWGRTTWYALLTNYPGDAVWYLYWLYIVWGKLTISSLASNWHGMDRVYSNQYKPEHFFNTFKSRARGTLHHKSAVFCCSIQCPKHSCVSPNRIPAESWAAVTKGQYRPFRGSHPCEQPEPCVRIWYTVKQIPCNTWIQLGDRCVPAAACT